jgi:hypothetical protein
MIRRNEPKGGVVKLVQAGYILVKREWNEKNRGELAEESKSNPSNGLVNGLVQ